MLLPKAVDLSDDSAMQDDSCAHSKGPPRQSQTEPALARLAALLLSGRDLFKLQRASGLELANMQTCMQGRLGVRAENTASTNSNFLSGRSVPVLQSRQRNLHAAAEIVRHSLQVQARSLEAGMGPFSGTKAGMTQIFTPEGLGHWWHGHSLRQRQ